MSRVYTEKELIDFTNYFLDNYQKDLRIKIGCYSFSVTEVSDADMRNFFGPDYDSIKIERKQKLEKLNKLNDQL